MDGIVRQASMSFAVDEEATWSDAYVWRKAILLGCGLMLAQNMTGATTVFYYSSYIFGIAGCQEVILGTCIVDLVNLVTTIYSCSIVDKVGRKSLLLHGIC